MTLQCLLLLAIVWQRQKLYRHWLPTILSVQWTGGLFKIDLQHAELSHVLRTLQRSCLQYFFLPFISNPLIHDHPIIFCEIYYLIGIGICCFVGDMNEGKEQWGKLKSLILTMLRQFKRWAWSKWKALASMSRIRVLDSRLTVKMIRMGKLWFPWVNQVILVFVVSEGCGWLHCKFLV